MDRFSVIVLERTADLMNELMEAQCHPGIAHCLKIVRQYIEEPASVDDAQLRDAVIRLLDFAREQHDVLIAARLASIVTHLSGNGGRSDAA
jgi:hypothetical protein